MFVGSWPTADRVSNRWQRYTYGTEGRQVYQLDGRTMSYDIRLTNPFPEWRRSPVGSRPAPLFIAIGTNRSDKENRIELLLDQTRNLRHSNDSETFHSAHGKE